MINTESKSKTIYTIEFLRIFFIFFIILGHIMQLCPDINTKVLELLHTKYVQTYFGVEFFFIIGGFFLFKRFSYATNTVELINKIYIRLLPGLLFVFLLCVVSRTCRIYQLPMIITLMTGLSIPGDVTGWGDWYVGVYFWCSMFYIALFSKYRQSAFLWTAILGYFSLCLKFHAPYKFMTNYYAIIGSEFIRAIYSMGIGMTTAFILEKISFQIKSNNGIRIFFTCVEIYCFILIFNYIVRSSHSHISFLEMEIWFSIFLISASKSYGYVTSYLNKLSKIQLLSRYAYPVLLGHIPFCKYLSLHWNEGLSDTTRAIFIFGGGVFCGIIEYHIIECKIVPHVKQYFSKGAKI